MSRDWTPEERAAASAVMRAAGYMGFEEFCAAPVLRLEYKGNDSRNRPVYEYNSRFYVDVDPRRSSPPKICTKQDNAFDGEPSAPIAENKVIIEFIPERVTWPF